MASISPQRMRVLVAGSGVGGLEALTGVAVLAGRRVELTLLSPDEAFAYRPASTVHPFALGRERAVPLPEVARAVGARLVRGRLVHVDDQAREVYTRDGDRIGYDALVVAMGARSHPPTPRGLTWDEAASSARAFAAILREVRSGRVGSVGIVIAARSGWPMRGYELALICAAVGSPRVKVTVVTAERRPLEALGEVPAAAIEGALERVGVELVVGAEPGRDLRLPRRGRLNVERLVVIGQLRPHSVTGLPGDRHGFLPLDEHARVPGAEGVWAAGNATAMEVKHSVLAARQADAAAAAIAAAAGAEVEAQPWEPTLEGILVVPPDPPIAATWEWPEGADPLTHCVWWPPGRVTGPHLARFITARDAAVRSGLHWHPHGLPVRVHVAQGEHAPERVVARPGDEVLLGDLAARQRLALGRLEREADRRAAEMTRAMDRWESHEREIVARLQREGYLHASEQHPAARA